MSIIQHIKHEGFDTNPCSGFITVLSLRFAHYCFFLFCFLDNEELEAAMRNLLKCV